MWKVIQYEIWSLSPSRVASGSVQQSDAPVDGANNHAKEEAEEPVLLDPTKGVLRVAWKNTPDAIEDIGAVSSEIIVKQVCSYESLDALLQYISEQFKPQEVTTGLHLSLWMSTNLSTGMISADTFTRLRRV
jgi:hypothetical protein